MGVPYWRSVRYTDDGCHLYQCLECKSTWEAVTAPGYFDSFVEVPAPCCCSFTYTEGDKERHVAKRKTPLYVKNWSFCPVCGVLWQGAIRCDDDNERMLGPKRLAREKLMYEHRPERKEPTWLWVIQVRHKDDDIWQNLRFFDPNITNAFQAYNWLLQERHDGTIDKYQESRVKSCGYNHHVRNNITTWNAQPHPRMKKYGTQKEETNKEKSETVGENR